MIEHYCQTSTMNSTLLEQEHSHTSSNANGISNLIMSNENEMGNYWMGWNHWIKSRLHSHWLCSPRNSCQAPESVRMLGLLWWGHQILDYHSLRVCSPLRMSISLTLYCWLQGDSSQCMLNMNSSN